MTLAGRPISGSSRAPARTTTKSGRHVASLNGGVPHVGQKRRRITLPLSALLMYSVVEPEISRLLLANMRLIEALPDDTYWQSLHQQAPRRNRWTVELEANGSAEASTRDELFHGEDHPNQISAT